MDTYAINSAQQMLLVLGPERLSTRVLELEIKIRVDLVIACSFVSKETFDPPSSSMNNLLPWNGIDGGSDSSKYT